MDESDEIKELIKRKTKLLKDFQKHNELADVIFQIGFSYYQKGYYREALQEFEHVLNLRKKLNISLDIATTHRFIGETLCKIGLDFEKAKSELDQYYSITIQIDDLVEIQRALTTLGNYFMSLAECNYKEKRIDHLNDAYSYYLKSYDALDLISEKNMVDPKEFSLMKARTCLNCAFVMDEKRDLIICTEYLKTAIDICEENNFYEDLIRCLYIKCDQARRKGKTEECLKVADRIVEITHKTKDFVQQSQDFSYAADLYIKVQNFEKAKHLLKKAYKLKNSCAISSEIIKKLKEIKNIIRIENEINQSYITINSFKENEPNSKEWEKIFILHENLGDSYCNIGLYELGLNSYLKQLNLTDKLNKSNSEIAIIYSSIAQTYQDLENFDNALKFFELELKTHTINDESECKTLLNIAFLKEKLQCEFAELRDIYMRALDKAEISQNLFLQRKVLNLLNETQSTNGIDTSETMSKIYSINNKIEEELSENEDEDLQSINESITFSSESDDQCSVLNDDEINYSTRNKNQANQKKYIVKRNIRGETQLHIACIKGNYNLVKKLIEEGHPVNERDNLNWLPIHEACNYGHTKIVEILLKNGAKVNDSIGPISPLHDAAQNGHLKVVKLLLDAGALSYVFSKDGYTPLDFLYKFKVENEANFTSDELNLYKEIFDRMILLNKAKDKNYTLKKVVNLENDFVIGETVLDDEDIIENRSFRSKMLNNLSDFEDDSSDSIVNQKTKKKAICEYRKAIENIGRRSSIVSSIPLSSKNIKDNVFVSESDYNINDQWLIKDGAKTSSNKRKYLVQSDDENSNDKRIKKNPKNLDFKNVCIKIRRNSKKKNVITNSNEHCQKDIKENSEEYLSENCDDSFSDITISNDLKQSEDEAISYSNKSKYNEIDLNENPPPKNNLTQKKIPYILNYKNKDISKTNNENTIHTDELSSNEYVSKSSVQSWRIKAVIDNKNFLIPVSNINLSINELTSQILNRYKIIFSNDQHFREPEKVILKNSDDLILFGEDLIKDVLTDMSQVKVLTESYKSIPKLNEFYEQICFKNGIKFNRDIKKMLIESEKSGFLNLKNISYDISQISYQFDVIFESVISYSHFYVEEITFVKKLTKIDLSSNYLSDKIINIFFENLLFSLVNLKFLDLSNNKLTIKNLKFLFELTNSNKMVNDKTLSILENLSLRGNDIGLAESHGLTNSDLADYLANLLKVFPKLNELDICDCKINFENIDLEKFPSQRDQVSINKFFSNFKYSNIKRLDISFNNLGFYYGSILCNNIQDFVIESLNMSYITKNNTNCKNDDKILFSKSIQILFHSSLTKIFLRNLNLKSEETSEILESLGVCKKLECLDLSFNEFDPVAINFIFKECPNIEKVYLVNNLTKIVDYNIHFIKILNSKLEDLNSKAIKILEFKFSEFYEIDEINNILKKRWKNRDFIKKFFSREIVELKIV